MKKVLITGAGSFVGDNVAEWLMRNPDDFSVDVVDTMNDVWKTADFSKYDTVFHVAGIAHIYSKPEMAPLYYSVNGVLPVEIAKHAKEKGVKQFIFMSSSMVYHASKSLKGDVRTKDTQPNPNDFYGGSKLQAEMGLRELDCETFNVCILRPPMIYGPGDKGNLPRLGWLATKTPVFPAWHNKRSMLYVKNLAEFVKQCIARELHGVFFPQNAEYSDTVEIVRQFAKERNHKIWISRLFNPLVWLGSFFVPAISKMFSDSYYEQGMSTYDFDYQLVSFEDSIKGLEIHRTLR